VRTVIELQVPEIGDYIDYPSNCVFSGHRRKLDENCALLGYYVAGGGNYVAGGGNYVACGGNYVAGGGNSLQTFRDNISVPSSKVKDF
jgi:hypothetical protein